MPAIGIKLAEQGKLKQFQVALDEKERIIQRLAANRLLAEGDVN